MRAGILFALLLTVASSAPAGEFQLWTEFGVEVPVAAHLHVGARSEARFTDDATRIGLYRGVFQHPVRGARGR